MLTAATHSLAAAQAPSHHGPSSSSSSLTSRWVAPVPQRRRPRHQRSSSVSKISCRASFGNNGEAGVVTIEPPSRELRDKTTVKMTAVASVHLKDKSLLENASILPGFLVRLVNRNWLFIELVSADEVDPETKLGRTTGQVEAKFLKGEGDFYMFQAQFDVPASFGTIGAVRLDNDHDHEMFIKDVKVFRTGDESNAIQFQFHCESWVIDTERKTHLDDSRVFFPLKSYLPSQTPKGLQGLRKSELETLRGDGVATGGRRATGERGKGTRIKGERIYDYDVYNDLGDPDHVEDDPKDKRIKYYPLRRPVLGGKDHPYPRRCRTGRRPCDEDSLSEERPAKGKDIYVPRDEEFSESKQLAFETKKILAGLHGLGGDLTSVCEQEKSFPSLAAIEEIFKDGFKNVPPPEHGGTVASFGFQWLKKELIHILTLDFAGVMDEIYKVIKFETPEVHDKDKLSWIKDEEFARETLAGMNPMSIQLVTELPIVSQLCEKTYAPRESLITPELIEKQINGVMTADEALKKKRLFMLDYHDVFLPYVNKVRELAHPKHKPHPEQTTLYGSRTLFFLTDEGTLKPIAIELTRPKNNETGQMYWRDVFTPGGSVTGWWLWHLAKTHVLAHDTGYHQLISHWLRTHCCVEPYIIAANRQLSQMHPIYRLLHPHFRYTMEINARAREMLINANGIIESNFSPKKYCLEMSSAVYDKFWRFDMEALPNDLIRRGMAVQREDGKLELTIEDYPYANDGLLVWDSIKEWVSDYVRHYYSTAADIIGDEELQAWWTEVRTKGHEDKKDEPWWPVIDSHESLVQVLATIIWVTSAHHAAVNFGQYPFAGYFPNRPTIARRNMPTEKQGGKMDEENMKEFMENPEKVLLDTLPSQFQSLTVLIILNLLSSHSPDEEYMATHIEPAWKAENKIYEAFERFQDRMVKIRERIENDWNKDPKRKNRCGPGVVPYTLLMPCDGNPFDDERSVMEMGIPNSISI